MSSHWTHSLLFHACVCFVVCFFLLLVSTFLHNSSYKMHSCMVTFQNYFLPLLLHVFFMEIFTNCLLLLDTKGILVQNSFNLAYLSYTSVLSILSINLSAKNIVVSQSQDESTFWMYYMPFLLLNFVLLLLLWCLSTLTVFLLGFKASLVTLCKVKCSLDMVTSNSNGFFACKCVCMPFLQILCFRSSF